MTRAGNPRLRALEAFPVEQQGRRCVALRDPAGFTDQIAVLPPPLLDLVSLFDGTHSVEEIREILQRRHGKAPTLKHITDVVERFDAAGFLTASASASSAPASSRTRSGRTVASGGSRGRRLRGGRGGAAGADRRIFFRGGRAGWAEQR